MDIMKKSINSLVIIAFCMANSSCAQTTIKYLSDAKKLEVNKKEFIGKLLSYFLDHINMDIIYLTKIIMKLIH